VNYKASDTVQVRMGAFKMPFSFEEMTSSRFIDFQERSLVNAFVPGKDQGLMIHGEPVKNTFGYAVAAMNGSGKNTDEANAVVDDKEMIVRGAPISPRWRSFRTRYCTWAPAILRARFPVPRLSPAASVPKDGASRSLP
jgi:hypothetical protein